MARELHEPSEHARMINEAVDGLVSRARRLEIDGWCVSMIEVEHSPHDVQYTIVGIVVAEGALLYGPISFPAEWAHPLREMLDNAVLKHEQMVTARFGKPANVLPA